MYLNIVGPISQLRLENENNHIQLGNAVYMTCDRQYLKQRILSDSFVFNMGGITLNILMKSNYIYSHITIENEASNTQVIEIFENYSNHIQLLLLSLWFIKDNSVNVPTLYLDNLDSEYSLSNSKNNMFSNSKGEYSETLFSPLEVLQVTKWEKIISSFFVKDDENETLKELNIEDLNFKNNNKKMPYNQFGRLTRALTFIQLARKESFLPLKITGYVGVLETIFSTENNEVAHQISERVSLFLDGNIEKKFNNYKLIKKIYGLRSDYVHGAKFNSKKYSEMENVCLILDELVREIMKKVLVEYSFFNNASKNEMNATFLNMIFEKSNV